MNISLPPVLRDWVDHQVEVHGFGTASEFVRDMLRRERERSVRTQVDDVLAKSIKTPLSKMTDGDWDDIKKAGRKLATKRKKA